MKTLTIKTIERELPNQWLLIEVTETKEGEPFKGIVINANTDRQKVVEAIGLHKDKRLYLFFSGRLASPDTTFAMYCRRL